MDRNGEIKNEKCYHHIFKTSKESYNKEGDRKMTIETQGKTDKDNISQNKTQTQLTQLETPKAGTATSSPTSSMEPSNK